METPKPRQHTDLLLLFGIARNPFSDRTAEKSSALDELSLVMPSDLRNFEPSPTTYVFFGRRGSGKTTIRLMMQRAYANYNSIRRMDGCSRGHFVVDLASPGHLTARLRAFQASMGASDDTWDAAFSESWTTADFVDCIMSVAATALAHEMGNPTSSVEGADMIARAASDHRIARQLLLLTHLYADCDAGTLSELRASLLPSRFHLFSKTSAAGAALGIAAAVCAGAGISRHQSYFVEHVIDEIDAAAPRLVAHPRLSLAAASAITGGAAWAVVRSRRLRSLARARAVMAPIRVVKHRPCSDIAALINACFSSSDGADQVRGLCVGISAHQKLDHLSSLLRMLGFESLAVFGDCFDEVSLLDPVAYPSTIKAFAKEACRNDLLNAGRLHLFFPDSRLALDLSTDKALKEARFDRHHVRDLTWSRHQLEELAERRFVAAQLEAQRRAAEALHSGNDSLSPRNPTTDAAIAVALSGNGGRPYKFSDLFREVRTEDLSANLSKVSTPRELFIMMSELLARLEANPEAGISAQDLDIAAQRALEQAV